MELKALKQVNTFFQGGVCDWEQVFAVETRMNNNNWAFCYPFIIYRGMEEKFLNFLISKKPP